MDGTNERGAVSMKKGKWVQIKLILFTYLAISKIMYWFNTVTTLTQADIDGVGMAVLDRLVSHDLLIILCVTAYHFFEK